MEMNPIKRILKELKKSIQDIQVYEGHTLQIVSHSNVAVLFQYRRNGLFGRELNVKARIKSLDGMSGQPNSWILSPELLGLFDWPPTICWLRDDMPFIQITGMVKAKELTINLW